MNCPSCRTLVYVSETKCPCCGKSITPRDTKGKPYGWDVTYEYRTNMGIATGSVNRVGPLSKARMAARLKSCFLRIVSERPIATQADYFRAYGDAKMRM